MTLALAKHIDFKGFEVTYNLDGFEVTFQVVDAPATLTCDMCDPEVDENHEAVYMIDALSEIGEAGHNSLYCQRHMDSLVFVYGPESGEQTWTLKA